MSTAAGYARHFDTCNRHDITRFVPLYIGGKRYGFVSQELAAALPQATGLFETASAVAVAPLGAEQSRSIKNDGITLSPTFTTFASRSAALMQATHWIAQHYGKKLRHEMYGIVEKWQDDPVAQIDRVAVPWFGIRAWGIHVNGFVRKMDGIHLWVGERAADRPADPGKLDNLIGGGQPIGLTQEQNLCKEAQEEAGIDAALAMTAKAVQTISYRAERNDGLRSDTLFIYDLELPEDFMPRNTDGEVAAFHLMPLRDVAAIVHDTDKFKFNCNLVIIDFMLRHSFITPQHAEYAVLRKWVPRR